MHVIEAIGTGEAGTSSTVAKKLSVTMGTLTKAIDRLSKMTMCFGREARRTRDWFCFLSRKRERGLFITIRSFSFYHRIPTGIVS